MKDFYIRMLARKKLYFISLVIVLVVFSIAAWAAPPSQFPATSPTPTKQVIQQNRDIEQKYTPFQYVTILMAITSPFISIFGTILGIRFGARLTTNREEAKERKRKLHALRAIKIEIQTVWTAYMKGPGEALEKRGKQEKGHRNNLGRHSEVSELSFTIYNHNSEIIGSLEDTTLAEKIIIAYQRLGGIFKALELNNKFWEEGINSLVDQDPDPDLARYNRLTALADILTERHTEISPDMKNLFEEMKAYIEKHDC